MPNGRLQERVRSIRWVLRLTWNTAPGFLIGLSSITLIRSMIPAALAWVIKSLVDSLMTEINASPPEGSTALLWLWLGLGLAVLDAVAGSVRTYVSRRLADDLNVKVTTDILSHAANLDIKFFEDPDAQDSLQRAKTVSGNSLSTLFTQIFGAISSVLQAVSLSAVLIMIQPWTLLVITLVAPPFLFVRWMQTRREYALHYDRQTKQRWTGYFMGLLTSRTNVAETRLLGLAPLLIRNYHTLIGAFRDQNRGIYVANLRAVLVFDVVSVGGFYALLTEIAFRAVDGRASLGDVALFLTASGRLRSGLVTGVNSLTGLLLGSLQVSALMELFEIKNSPRMSSQSLTPDCAGAITIQDVDFTYPGSSQAVLKDLSLEIRAGETVALVGENGCGKTTLAKLIARLYIPDRGRIILDGQDIQELEIQSLYRQIAFVFQNFIRYEASAADNIAYGDLESCLNNRESVEKIARSAGVHNMIMAMPNGYETMLGRSFGTFDLSGGQWQMLAVARAFARRSSLLILDEPSASLDARAEYELFVRARKLAQGKTTILISHRFSTVAMADRILVMDRGRIVENGSHRELLSRDGHYAKLYELHQRHMPSAP